MSKKTINLLIEAEEDAKKYLLPISMREWMYATRESPENYELVSIDTLVDFEKEFDLDDDDISEAQIRRYQETRLGMKKKEMNSVGIESEDLKEYNLQNSLMKYIMIKKGREAGAKVIVDLKIQDMKDKQYMMTGIGLVPAVQMDLYAHIENKEKTKGEKNEL